MTLSREHRRADHTNWFWIAAIVVLLIVGAGAYTLVTHRGGENITSTAPRSVDPSSVPLTDPSTQLSPQGPTGPLNTTSNGAPADNPRGQSPPGMQSGPGATPSTPK